MDPRTVLITGCSSGIGLALATKLANDEQQRFKVIATMRNLAKRSALEEAAGAALNRTLEIKELDVCSESSIRKCVDSVPDRRVDILKPGPVNTEFELKTYEDAMRGDYSKTDPETADMFTNYYLKNSKAIFSSLGQSPEDIAEHVLRVVTMEVPPFRHQTNQVFTPLTALKYADPSGELMTDVFYKMVFEHDTLMQASLRAIKLLRWKANKVQQGARILGFM